MTTWTVQMVGVWMLRDEAMTDKKWRKHVRPHRTKHEKTERLRYRRSQRAHIRFVPIRFEGNS